MKLIVWIISNEVKLLKDFLSGKSEKPPTYTTIATNKDQIGIILNNELKQYDDPYNVYHLPNSIEVVAFGVPEVTGN